MLGGRTRSDLCRSGVAQNMKLTRALEEESGMDVLVQVEPQIMGASGGALLGIAAPVLVKS